MYEELGVKLLDAMRRSEAAEKEKLAAGTPEWSERLRLRVRWGNLQREAAVKFGSLFGGKLTKPFSFQSLVAGRRRESSWMVLTDSETTDHPFYYQRDRRPAVIAAHLYSDDVDRVREFARENRVLLWLPDFPSWHYPGYTTLVAYLGPSGLFGLWMRNPDITAGLGYQIDPTNVLAAMPK